MLKSRRTNDANRKTNHGTRAGFPLVSFLPYRSQPKELSQDELRITQVEWCKTQKRIPLQSLVRGSCYSSPNYTKEEYKFEWLDKEILTELDNSNPNYHGHPDFSLGQKMENHGILTKRY